MTRFARLWLAALWLAPGADASARSAMRSHPQRGMLPRDVDRREEYQVEDEVLEEALRPTAEEAETPWFCRRDSSRFSLFPIRDAGLWRLYKQAVASFWTAEEVDLAADVHDWEALDEGERHFLSRVLAFFASSDGIVIENLMERFATEVSLPEARFFYGFQIAIEAVHQEMYSLLLETYVADAAERSELFRAHELVPCVQRKAAWAQKWTASKDASYARRLVAFAAVEGIFFSGSFCAVFWLRKRGVLPGLGFANELISRDEGLHCDFACALYHRLDHKLPDDVVHSIIREAVDVEREFVTDALPVSLVGMNARLMSQYVEYVADRLLLSLGHPKLYGAANPFDWMELMSLTGKTNFFEKRVAEYSKSNVVPRDANAEATARDFVFNTDVDF